jgi:hypothetical protein
MELVPQHRVFCACRTLRLILSCEHPREAGDGAAPHKRRREVYSRYDAEPSRPPVAKHITTF